MYSLINLEDCNENLSGLFCIHALRLAFYKVLSQLLD